MLFVLGESYIVLVLIPLIAALLGFGGALAFKLEKQETSTIMIEASVQNTALALGIVLASIPDKLEQVQALGVPLVYAPVGNVFTILYAIVLFKLGWSYGNADENPCLSFLRKFYGCCNRKDSDAEDARATKVEVDEENEARSNEDRTTTQ